MTGRGSARMKATLAVWAIFLVLQSTSASADGIVSTTSGTADYTLTATTALAPPTGPPPQTAGTTLTGTVATGSTMLTVPSTTGLAVGYSVSGTGIPTGTTITQIDTSSSQVTLSQGATANGAESLTFTPVIAPPQVVALIQPAGGVVTPPSSATEGPLTILSASQGISTSGIYDYLASTTSNGQPLQALGLSFYGNGLAAGDTVKFSLNVANQNSPPQLISQTPGVAITLTPASSSPPASTPVADAVPEPVSVLLWSLLAGAGLLRADIFRRRGRPFAR